MKSFKESHLSLNAGRNGGGTKKENLYKKIFPEGGKVLQKMLHLVWPEKFSSIAKNLVNQNSLFLHILNGPNVIRYLFYCVKNRNFT